MKKCILVLLLILCMLCMSGCVDGLLNDQNLATTDVLQVMIHNEEVHIDENGIDSIIPFFTEEELENATDILLEGEAVILLCENHMVVQKVPADKLRVRETKIYKGEKLQESYFVLEVPYKNLAVVVDYYLDLNNLQVGLKGDGQRIVKEPARIDSQWLRFTPKYVGEGTPESDAKPEPEVPKTGDASHVAVWCALACMSAAAIVAILRKKQEV